MAETRRIVRVFLASPGDLQEERKAAKLVVDEFNSIFAGEMGYQIELVGWEDTISATGRPQAIINRELERCEIFVGLMWKRWGTPPDHGGKYSSGFEEEFRRSFERRRNGGRPEMSLLFKDVGAEFLWDPGEDLKKVLTFKKELVDGKEILFEQFRDLRDFESKFRRCVSSYILSLRSKETEEAVRQNQAPTATVDGQLKESESVSAETPLTTQGVKFLREFISRTEHVSEETPLQPLDIARFRLLATVVRDRRNDEQTIGVHDSNLLFSERGAHTFGRRELFALLGSGLEHYSNKNVPLWHWLVALDGLGGLLPMFSLGSSTTQRVGALSAMTLISEPLPTDDGPLDREFFWQSWFRKEAPSAVRLAALRYLGDCGTALDLSPINEEVAKNDSQTVAAAAEAILRIHLRDSQEKAIKALYELQPVSVAEDVLAALFRNEESIGTETLLSGVDNRSPAVRLTVVGLLRGRGALSIAVAERLLGDSSADVRYEALQSLSNGGRVFSEEEAKSILVKHMPGRGLFFGFGTAEKAGEDCFARFRNDRIRSLTDSELEALLADDSVFDRDAQFVLAERHFARYGRSLRQSFDDRFKTDFERAFKKFSEALPPDSSAREELRSLEEFLRKKFSRRALDVICHRAQRADLARVRHALSTGDLPYSDADVEYLRRFGEWEDISLIVQCLSRVDERLPLFVISDAVKAEYRAAARAILALGRRRFPALLRLSIPNSLLTQIIIEAPEKAYRGLGDSAIGELLASESDTVRKAAVIKCVRVLGKARVTTLLENYPLKGSRYYNVVHWLDFGASLPRERTLAGSAKALALLGR
jgi:hypothetical protein